MSSDLASLVQPLVVRCQDVSKSYPVYERPLHRLTEALGMRDSAEHVEALHPLTLTIRRGESVGIVGRNGSGKSTLLSLIAGIVTPTTGEIETVGRVAALLELGSGFNPEFTGRENVFFYATVQGLSRREIESRFAAIAAFAEIGEFIDRPVKTYSSGMFVRLAFSVAVHLDPDVLIVDEALSVGDVFFQQKCFERIRTLRAAGTTLLFVSHDSSAVLRFCDRALLLDRGHLVADGPPQEVVELYEAALIRDRDARHANGEVHPASDLTPDMVTSSVTLTACTLRRPAGGPGDVLKTGETVRLEASFAIHADVADPHVGFRLRDRFGSIIFETNTYCMNAQLGARAAGDVLDVSFDIPLPLAPGDYTFTLGLADGGRGLGDFDRQLLYLRRAATVRIVADVAAYVWSGIVDLAVTLVDPAKPRS